MIDRPSRFVRLRHYLSTRLLAVLVLMAVAAPAQASERKIISRVRPEYPPIAKRMKIAGTVMLSVVVTPSGQVKAANFVMGEKILLEAAQHAIEKWKYEPAGDQTVEDVELEFPRDAAVAK